MLNAPHCNSLLHAQKEGNFNLAKKLFMENPELATQGDPKGKTPIHHAALRNKTEYLEMYLKHELIKKMEAFNLGDEHGITPLHEAAVGLSYESAQLLTEAGADFHATDDAGEKPLDYCLRFAKVKKVKPYFRFHTCPTLFSLAAQQLDQQSKLKEICSESVRIAAEKLVSQQKANQAKEEAQKRYLAGLKY